MLTAYNVKGRQVFARDVTKADGPFACPECGGEVIVKKGSSIIHHYAHVPPFTCSMGAGESPEHLAAKLEIHDALSPLPHVSRLMVERTLNKLRFDVSFRVNNRHCVTAEIQYSQYSPDEISDRTSHYTNTRIYALWLLPYPEKLVEGEVYATKLMARYMHALYFGTVYYWRGADIVLPVHFHKYSLGSVYREWYDEDEGRWHAGEVEQFPRNHSRIPEFHEEVHITDLKPFMRKAGKFGSYDFPAARLWGLDKPWFRRDV